MPLGWVWVIWGRIWRYGKCMDTMGLLGGGLQDLPFTKKNLNLKALWLAKKISYGQWLKLIRVFCNYPQLYFIEYNEDTTHDHFLKKKRKIFYYLMKCLYFYLYSTFFTEFLLSACKTELMILLKFYLIFKYS